MVQSDHEINIFAALKNSFSVLTIQILTKNGEFYVRAAILDRLIRADAENIG